MKIRINRKSLADTATWVAQAIPKMPSHPEMSGIRINATDTDLILDGYNFETSHCATLAADVLEPGSVLVAARTFTSIINALRTVEVEITLDGERVTIAAGKSEYRLGVMRVDHFPNLPDHPPTVAVLPHEELDRIIGTVEHAASKDDIVPALSAINLTSDGRTITAIATDRFRIARDTATCEPGGAPFAAIMPKSLITASIKGLSGTIEVGHNEGTIGFTDGSRSVTTRLIEAEYPKLDPLLAFTPEVTGVANAADLLDAIKRAALVLERNQPLYIDFEHESGELVITADDEISGGTEYVSCEIDGGDYKTAVNHAFAAQILALVGDRDVEISVAEKKPVRIVPVGDTTQSFVVMTRRRIS